jgi:hypothetical protein
MSVKYGEEAGKQVSGYEINLGRHMRMDDDHIEKGPPMWVALYFQTCTAS